MLNTDQPKLPRHTDFVEKPTNTPPLDPPKVGANMARIL